jgi:hypothetical protein
MPSCLNAARLEKSEQRPVSPESENERIGCALAATAVGIMNLSAKKDEIKAEKRAIAAPSHIVAPESRGGLKVKLLRQLIKLVARVWQ